MITKQILNQYMDLKKEVSEVRLRISRTEEEILRIEEDGSVIDKVSGGLGGIQSFRIEGFPYPEYNRKKTLLYARKTILSGLEAEIMETLNKVEEFLAGVQDSHIRRIITLRIVEGLSWNEVADRIGGGNNENSVKKAFHRYMEQ